MARKERVHHVFFLKHTQRYPWRSLFLERLRFQFSVIRRAKLAYIRARGWRGRGGGDAGNNVVPHTHARFRFQYPIRQRSRERSNAVSSARSPCGDFHRRRSRDRPGNALETPVLRDPLCGKDHIGMPSVCPGGVEAVSRWRAHGRRATPGRRQWRRAGALAAAGARRGRMRRRAQAERRLYRTRRRFQSLFTGVCVFFRRERQVARRRERCLGESDRGSLSRRRSQRGVRGRHVWFLARHGTKGLRAEPHARRWIP